MFKVEVANLKGSALPADPKIWEFIKQIQNGENPIPGSYRGRKNSEPENNRKTLINIKNA